MRGEADGGGVAARRHRHGRETGTGEAGELVRRQGEDTGGGVRARAVVDHRRERGASTVREDGGRVGRGTRAACVATCAPISVFPAQRTNPYFPGTSSSSGTLAAVGHWFPRAPAMAPPKMPGAGGSRSHGKGGYKGRMGKRFKKNPNGSDKPKRPKTGFGVWGVGALFGAMLGLVAFVARREEAAARAADDTLRARLRRKPLRISDHAACRMDCRQVSREDVEATLERGKLSKRHSTPDARPCPRWALEDGRVRAVWAGCRDETALVTVIDTVTDHPCGPC